MSAEDCWHAVCRDCPDLEAVGAFDDVFAAGKEHQDETGHSVTAGRVD